MAIISLKKTNTEDVMAVGRISANVLAILKSNNINISKTIRDHLNSIAADLKISKPRKRAS
jgi:hypothetical protein